MYQLYPNNDLSFGKILVFHLDIGIGKDWIELVMLGNYNRFLGDIQLH